MTILAYLAAITVLMLTPGPDMLFVLANSARYGARAGIRAALGVAAGEAIHIGAVVLGLATLVTASPLIFSIIRYAGAAYLVVLGLRALRTSPQGAPTVDSPPQRAFLRGLLTNLLNPKMILFSLAFLPQFVDRTAGHVTAQLLLLGTLFVAVQLGVDIALGLGAGRLARFFANPVAGRRLQRSCAAVFIALGVRLATT